LVDTLLAAPGRRRLLPKARDSSAGGIHFDPRLTATPVATECGIAPGFCFRSSTTSKLDRELRAESEVVDRPSSNEVMTQIDILDVPILEAAPSERSR
jgi:hypothetical protein